MNFSLARLNPNHPRQDFDCGNGDLNEFFSIDSIDSAKQLLSVTYSLERDGSTIGFISVSNDSIKKEDLEKSIIKRLLSPIPRPKRYKSRPAVKIGRLGISKDCARSGVGTTLLDYVKVWFTNGNKTGCRFIIVDAYNEPRVIAFYKKNNFEFLIPSDSNDATRLMYFDLALFRE